MADLAQLDNTTADVTGELLHWAEFWLLGHPASLQVPLLCKEGGLLP